MKPVLLKLYRSQMNTYQLAIQNFIAGYKEGVNEKADLDAWISDLEGGAPAEQTEDSKSSTPDLNEEKAAAADDSLYTDPDMSAGGEPQKTSSSPGQRPSEPASNHQHSPDINLMESGEIDEWNVRIMSQLESSQNGQAPHVLQDQRVADIDSEISQSAKPFQESLQQEIDPVSVKGTIGPVATNEEDSLDSSSQAIAKEISDALAEAEKLSAIMMKGTPTSEQRQEFRQAVERADTLLSQVKS